MGVWVMSPAADMAGFVLPVLLALPIICLARSLPSDEVPLYCWIPLGVMIDVAHVYGTLYRTLLDSEACAKNWALFLLAGPGLLVVALCVNVVGGTQLGWSLLAYYAMYHFAKQPYGILCLYKARRGERGMAEHNWDYWTCMAGALMPTLLNHAGGLGPDGLYWFNAEEDYLFRLPSFTIYPLWLLYVAVPAAWFGRLLWQHASGQALNYGKIWIMVVQYFTWGMAGATKSQLTGLVCHNVFHGISSMALVYFVVKSRYLTWRKDNPATMQWRDKLNETLVSSPVLYMGLMVLLAFIEEISWDSLVTHEYLPGLGFRHLPKLKPQHRAVATSVLMLPQLSHYFLDGFIWKLNMQNPGLRDALLRPEATLMSGGKLS